MLRSSFDSSSVKEDTGLLESAAEHEKEPDAKVDHKRSLDWIALAALLFFNVSGGPIGTEGLVAAVGPFYRCAAIVCRTCLLVSVIWI